MAQFRRILCFSAAVLSVSFLNADTLDVGDEISTKDIQALREWINTKRQITVKELGGSLSISGEVRAEMQAVGETVNGIKQRGVGGVSGRPSRSYDVEVNLMLDYRADRTWAAIKLEFDNDAGVFSGTLDRLKLEKAYFGVRLIDADTFTTDVEIGRRRLITIFDSRLEFDSFFDGVLFKYDQAFESIGAFYVHAGVFVINDFRDQYGYVGEIGLLNIGNTGFYTKYSLIDWDTKKYPHKVENERFDFIISQLILGYKFLPEKLKKLVVFYAAGLYNHRARKLAITAHKRANWGTYTGVSIGELRKKGDWAFDANYQVLAAQAVPDFDATGIGLGNSVKAGLYTKNVNGTGGPTTRKTAAGNGNYRGFEITLDYLLTNNLDLQQQYKQAITLDDSIGPFRRFKQYEIEFIYGF